jgi:ankyrin repeat protein
MYNALISTVLTPLAHAATRGHTIVVRLLLKQDSIDVNSAKYKGDTPLACAAERAT